jgi:hypothetical protein
MKTDFFAPQAFDVFGENNEKMNIELPTSNVEFKRKSIGIMIWKNRRSGVISLFDVQSWAFDVGRSSLKPPSKFEK